MKDSQLINLLKLIDKDDWAALGKFVRSPFFNDFPDYSQRDIELLFDYTQKHFHLIKGSGQDSTKAERMFSDEVIFRHVCNGKDWKGKTSLNWLNKRKSALKKLVQKFIAYQYSDTKDVQFLEELSLLRFYRKREARKEFVALKTKLERSLDKVTVKGEEHYFDYFQLVQEVATFESYYNNRRKDLQISRNIEYLDKYYILSLLELTCVLIQQSKFIGDADQLAYTMTMVNSLNKLIEDRDYSEIPLVKSYRLAHFLQLDKGSKVAEGKLQELLDLLKINHDKFPAKALRNLHTISRNYCTKMFREDRPEFLRILNKLYKRQLELGLLDQSGTGYIKDEIYTNVVNVGLLVKDFEWVHRFIYQYKDSLAGVETSLNGSQPVFLLSLANYYFHQEKYEMARMNLEKVKAVGRANGSRKTKFKDKHIQHLRSLLEIKLLFEKAIDISQTHDESICKGPSEILEVKLKALQRSNSNIENPESVRLRSENFRRQVYKIRNLIEEYGLQYNRKREIRSKLEEIKREIQNTRYIAEKIWLLQKTNKLLSLYQEV